MADQVAKQIEQAGLSDRIHMAGLWADTARCTRRSISSRRRRAAREHAAGAARSDGLRSASRGDRRGRRAGIVEVGTTGFLAGPQDCDGVATSVIELLEHPERLPELGRAARARAATLFDIRTSARLTGELFRQVARSRERHSAEWAVWPALQASS
jgi:hypothetical protein